jgi:hypothetical protein
MGPGGVHQIADRAADGAGERPGDGHGQADAREQRQAHLAAIEPKRLDHVHPRAGGANDRHERAVAKDGKGREQTHLTASPDAIEGRRRLVADALATDDRVLPAHRPLNLGQIVEDGAEFTAARGDDDAAGIQDADAGKRDTLRAIEQWFDLRTGSKPGRVARASAGRNRAGP